MGYLETRISPDVARQRDVSKAETSLRLESERLRADLTKEIEMVRLEVEKVRVLIREGGYLVNCDHHIPPDVSYENIRYFLNEVNKLSVYEETRRVIA